MRDAKVPATNVKAFTLLYQIETGIRELVIDGLSAVEGPGWYKSRLPADVLEKYRSGRKYELGVPWTRCIPHHPLYYVDFPDLRKTIERADNWRQVFEPIFQRKELLAATLIEVEPIRNKVAHNRKISDGDLAVVQGTYHKLATMIGDERFRSLSARCTIASDIPARLSELRREACNALKQIERYAPLGELTCWQRVRKEWWFDESYLGARLDGIRSYFTDLAEYETLPRNRGSGHFIEAWVRSKDISSNFSAAIDQFVIALADTLEETHGLGEGSQSV